MKDIRTRPVDTSDKSRWLRLRCALWPSGEPTHELDIERYFQGTAKEPQFVLVAEVDGDIGGFAELSIRLYAEGCETDHVGYLEGLYVEPGYRGRGVGRALVEAGENWARSEGCIELASDAYLENRLSAEIHGRLGFEEVGRIRCFRKPLIAS